MIPVRPAPEPEVFEEMVRRRGLEWLEKKGWPPGQPPEKASELPPYWQATSKELWEAYDGVCAYLAIFFEWPLGAQSTDHFVAKSRDAGLAYEWSNYRLSCLGANRRKGRFDDILDPFEMGDHTFELNLASGKITPNPALPEAILLRAQETIGRLGLDDPMLDEMRARRYGDYCQGDVSAKHLKRESPFIYYELERQGLL